MELFFIITLTILGAYAWFKAIDRQKKITMYIGLIGGLTRMVDNVSKECNETLLKKEKELQRANQNLEEMRKIIVSLGGTEKKLF